ncbi:YigZ family protein [Staphylococcus massiliensis]|uniref:YigZ family protein n=1 Tax=Staphylococcus massiliensis S46 TaxID=1229783 RepID=K9AMB3_9STAP|nr:YigZ family protein [Staphylococcus massiliensis]EKU48518.1 hypothetical protein C273_04885 [Staphylococcus massiliensis S46]MCG3400071.1 YigZ family protein [Staphylococcus massiliensis]MCG3401794.1 YigZ family protein [Staphylococcus massiliensis]POA01527.1 YigZ family protein [Staphylococcus massiliensis CCUG 55927]
MKDDVITIKSEHQFETVINKSRFICYIKPVQTEDDAKAFIQSIKKKHHEATHNCSCYTIGDTMNIQKANDDGEPSGTAGVPMLEVLKKNDIHNTVAVVTRYFGGIKLGGGGLIRAYSGAVRNAVNDIGLVVLKNAIPMTVTVSYDLTGKLEHEIQSTTFMLKDTTYTDKVSYDIDVIETERDDFIDFLNRHTQSNYELHEGDVTRLPFDLEK